MSYQVPQKIDNDKIFIVNRSEIEGRFDPSVYKPHFKFVSKAFRNVKLSEIAWIDPSCMFKNIEEVSFIPMDAIDSSNGVISYQGIKKVEETKGFTRFKEGDILWAKITPCMQNAKSAIAKKLINGYGCGSTEFFVIRSKDENVVLQEYLLFLLRDERILKAAMNYFGGSAGQQRVSPLFLKTFNVPLPEIEEQKSYCELLKNAQILKQQKEQQSEDILNSIDGYLLGELGIELPTIRNTLKDRIFLLNRRELEGRFDPTVYKDGIKLISTKWNNVKLSKVAFVNPSGAYKGKSVETPISFVPMEVIDERFSDITTVEETTIEQSSGFTKFREGDLLWAKITPCMQNGKSAVAKNLKNGLGCGSTEYFVLRPKDEHLAIEYLHVILHMKCVRETAMLYFGGSAGQQRVSSSFLENFNLPLPPKEKQVEIANHVYKMRQQAKALQEEGKAILEQAKREVERMILG